MNNKSSIEAIKLLALGIEKHIDNMDIQYSNNLYEYRLKDFLQLDTIIKHCSRCGKLFAPRLNSMNTQQYCSDDCRYNSTKETRKIIKQDEKYHRIDCLRKLIYERKYRAKVSNRKLTSKQVEAYEQLLIDLKYLSKNRNNIPKSKFNKLCDEIHTRYNLSSSL